MSSLPQRGMSDTNGNRLIRVACGYAPTLFGSSVAPAVAPASTQVTSRTASTLTTAAIKSILSNSILNTQRPEINNPIQLPSIPVILESVVVNKDYGQDDDADYEANIVVTSTTSQKTTTTDGTSTTKQQQQQQALKNGLLSVLSQDYLLIIAVVCGIVVVLIAINIFCIWNYYK